MINLKAALAVLEQATSFATKKARDGHAKAVADLRAALLEAEPAATSKALAEKLARKLMRLGDEVTPCQRIQFKCGAYPDAETNGGGMNETALVDFFAGIISAEPAAAEGQAGWKWVPVDPTEEMMDAYDHAIMTSKAVRGRHDIWLAMLSAAPLPSGQQEGGKG